MPTSVYCVYVFNSFNLVSNHMYNNTNYVIIIITTGHRDKLDNNMEIENKNTRAEERPIMPVYIFLA